MSEEKWCANCGWFEGNHLIKEIFSSERTGSTHMGRFHSLASCPRFKEEKQLNLKRLKRIEWIKMRISYLKRFTKKLASIQTWLLRMLSQKKSADQMVIQKGSHEPLTHA